MTISTDTIRTVIEIVPDWEIIGECTDGDPIVAIGERPDILSWSTSMLPQWALDALAAAAVDVIDKNGYAFAVVWPKDTSILRNEKGNEQLAYHEGPNRTDNTLLAIAEFVKGGGFDGV